MMQRLSRLDSHHRFFWSLVAGGVGFLLVRDYVEPPTAIVASWDLFAGTDLLMMWIVLTHADPVHARKTARLQDTGRKVLFVLVIVAALIAFLSVAFILGPARALPGSALSLHLALSVAAIIVSWGATHTVFALRYAHLFYSGEIPEDAASRHGGLEFPGGKAPDYLDFAYFSFVIGMTFQVSDVQITSRPIRRLVLVHGLLSFVFVTVILALTIGAVSGILSIAR